jgi:hypothetical protein
VAFRQEILPGLYDVAQRLGFGDDWSDFAALDIANAGIDVPVIDTRPALLDQDFLGPATETALSP